MDRLFEEKEPGGWKSYFLQLRRDSMMDTVDAKCDHAIIHRQLNRYSDVLPYDDTRVVIHSGETGYINASHVHFSKTGQKYVMAQGPLDWTAGTFWRMVWEQGVSTIVMLCRCYESRKSKCARYWPDGGAETGMELTLDSFLVSFMSCEPSPEYNITHLTLKNTATGEIRGVCHFQYHAWPDFGIPETPDSFLRFLVHVRRQNEGSEAPVVHCSAGIGRSGVYAVIDIIVRLLETSSLDGDSWGEIDFEQILMELRRQRAGLIQAPDQLRFTFMAVLRARRLMDQRQWPRVFLQHINAGPGLEDDFPPPPPPIRSESLSQNTSHAGRHLPNGMTDDVPPSIRSRKAHTAEKVREIKENMQRIESRQTFWSNYLPHLLAGGLVLAAAVAFAYWRNSGV